MTSEPDILLGLNSKSVLANLSSRDLIERWRDGSQDAASVLMDRYELRLVALIASRLSRRFRGSIDPQDVVQSAMGSFFRMTRSSTRTRNQLKSSVSAWNLLATFARRKLSRSLEREMAMKRGGGWSHTSLDQAESAGIELEQTQITPIDECLNELQSSLSHEHARLLALLLENATQREIADELEVDERTVRRRIVAMRKLLAPHLSSSETDTVESNNQTAAVEVTLPRVAYGQFVLGKMIGRGGFGKVYRARMQNTDEIVAVKFMHRHLWSDSLSKSSFLSEVDHASKIHHPGIVKYLGWGESPHGGPFILSELIVGRSMADFDRDDGASMASVLSQLCQAVIAAHEAGVVHGDLTPSNVLIGTDGRVVITDFGFASSLGPIGTESESAQSPSLHGGTLGFAAPEQFASAFGQIGPATDIYAIGGIAYFMLTGQAPHMSEALSDSLLDTLSNADIEIDEQTTESFEKIARVARAALKKAVSDRPGSAKELLGLLSSTLIDGERQ